MLPSDLCYLVSFNDLEDSPPQLEHAIRLICPNFNIPMENAILMRRHYRLSSNEKKIFEAKVAEIVKRLG